MITQEFTVSENDAGLRLDEFVTRHLPGFTKGAIIRAIDYHSILLNNRVSKKGFKLRAGDTIQIKDLSSNRVYPNPDVPVSVIYRDDYLFAINKPAGLPAHPNRPHERDTLANGLIAAFPQQEGIGDSPLVAGILHRLDTDTSGLTLAARTQEIFDYFRTAFSERQLEKTYLALVEGRITEKGRLEHNLIHNPQHPGHMIDADTIRDPERPMKAVTRYQPIREFRNHTLLEVGIRTGVTHQIRCQLSLAGFPIVGDTRYGGQAVPGFPRHFLHASAIEFSLPGTQQITRLEAPLTKDLNIFLAGLR